MDFFYTAAGEILVNEINTMPGMTPASGFPMMWAASGLPMPQLVDRIIQTALGKRSGPRLSVRIDTPAGGVQEILEAARLRFAWSWVTSWACRR